MGVVFALIAVLLVLLGGTGATLAYARFIELTPVTSTQGGGEVVTITQGETLNSVAAKLESEGLIRSATWFAAYARVRGIELRAGRYLVDSGMGATEMVSVLEGPNYQAPLSITLPEGLTVEQIAERVGSSSLRITRSEYLAAVSQGGYTSRFLSIRPAGDTSLEGFLFPDTYTVAAGATATQLVQMQLDDFASKAAPLLPANPSTAAYSDLVIASLLQAEVLPGDFADVASVIDNRLAMGMDLQLDTTVMYGLHQVGHVMSSADEATNTPYNTYLHAGLPPTPIDDPGSAAIKAAQHPASTPYLYYVTDACGHTYYSVTEAQHEKQVQEYLGKCPSSP